uniref:Paired domain-containing protein n=1 Tax=Cyprinus carpio carpio TaxID=630221 RepID=A0A9J7WXH6_CYPCA
MRATHSKKVGTGSNKRPEKLNAHIRNSWRTNLQLIRSIGNMIGYKKSLSEWQCLSEVKMSRGSPIPPILQRKIVEQYQKGVSQRKNAKSLKLSSSTVHNIIQRFRDSGTISVRKGQGRKTILDARDLRALRRHCITYRNATVMEITTWAQEYFQKTLSVNTIRCRLKLYRSKKKPYLNMIQKCRRFLWAKAHLKWTVAKWKTVLCSDESKFEVRFGKLGCHVIWTKEDKDNPSCYQRSVQKPASLMVWGCMSVCVCGVCVCVCVFVCSFMLQIF